MHSSDDFFRVKYVLYERLNIEFMEWVFVRVRAIHIFMFLVPVQCKVKKVKNKRYIMSVIKRCYRGVLLMRVQSCYYLKRFCGATKRMSEIGLRLEYHSNRNKPVNAYEMCFVFPSDANRCVGNLFRFCTKWSLYTNVEILRNHNV